MHLSLMNSWFILQSVWVLSNRLPIYLYSQLDFNDINFRIQRAGVREAVVGSSCDPNALRHLIMT